LIGSLAISLIILIGDNVWIKGAMTMMTLINPNDIDFTRALQKKGIKQSAILSDYIKQLIFFNKIDPGRIVMCNITVSWNWNPINGNITIHID
jgi:hypothetical protein